MHRLLKHLTAILFLVLVVGCAAGGGGCTGGGLTPLAAGFKPAQRIENAGSFRLTESGIGFLEQNLGVIARGVLGGESAGVITFPIGTSSGSALVDYTVCPGGPDANASPPKCVAEIDAGSAALQIEPRGPHNLRVHGPLPVRLQNLPIFVDYGFLGDDTPIATLNDNDACPPNAQTFSNIELDVELSIEIDVNPAHSRHGYSRLEIVSLSVDEDRIESSLHLNCGDSITGDILDFLKPVILPLVIDPLVETLTGEIEQQLCQHENAALDPPCPDGTKPLAGICRYVASSSAEPKATDECASILLGIDGHLDLGQLFSSISPGTRGGIDLLFAGGGEGKRGDDDFAWGDLNPVANGLTLGMYGGAEPLPLSKCVPLSELALPTGIPIPDELVANGVTGWPADVPGPHVGVALSESFANYALNGMYNSGLLCIGISTETVSQLDSGLFGLLDSTLANLGLQQEKQQIAIAIRPQQPPSVTFGDGTDIATDPLIRVKLNQATFDFYVWSLDRFIRFMTATFDLDVPVNLTVTPGGLAPVISTIGTSNGKVTNIGLLHDAPEVIAEKLSGLIGSFVGTALGGSLPVLDVNSALSGFGLSLVIPETVDGAGSPGLRKLTKGNEKYLGLFAAFAVSSAQAPLRSETRAELRQKQVQPEGLRLSTITPDNAPTAQLVMGSDLDDGTRTIEYGYRIDQGPWRPFTRERLVALRDDWLRLQGRHVISVRSRIAGEPMSLDPTPATVELLVDVDPPAIAVGAEKAGEVSLEVRDRVSGAERASVRVRLDDGAWSPWTPAVEMKAVQVGRAVGIEVEAKDEEGNLGTARQAIIRGRGPIDGSAGCGCAVAGGAREGSAGSWLVGLAVAAIGARLGRRRARAAGGAGGVAWRARAAAVAGGARHAAAVAGGARHAATGLAVIAAIGAHAGCSCGDDPSIGPRACVEPDCVTLEPGLIGAYTSVAVDKSTVWVAGYAEGDWYNIHPWGDLVVGVWNGTSVDWELVDGVPEEPDVDPAGFNVSGFRGGQVEPGDDVGLWTSIAVGPDGEPAVAYFDRTNRGLKFAQKQGATWAVSAVQTAANSDIGRYAKLLFVDGVPVIAYLAIEPGKEMDGAITSSVRIATGSSATPGEDGWRFEDVATNPATPCREYLCGAGTKCIQPTGRCEKPLETIACAPACADDQACVDSAGAPACAAVYGSGRIDTYPDAIGDYVSMAPDGKGGFGLSFYDRTHGNLVIAAKSNGAWETRIVDGETPDGTDTGDVGMGSSLFIDRAGDWHLAYVDGYAEGLRYARVKGGAEVGVPEVPDDGLGIADAPFPDGQHLVGDDAKVFVSSSGEVRISYQDATVGALRLAVGVPGESGHSWRVKAIEQDGFAGAFSQILDLNGQILIANWWRLGGQTARGDVAIVKP